MSGTRARPDSPALGLRGSAQTTLHRSQRAASSFHRKAVPCDNCCRHPEPCRSMMSCSGSCRHPLLWIRRVSLMRARSARWPRAIRGHTRNWLTTSAAGKAVAVKWLAGLPELRDLRGRVSDHPNRRIDATRRNHLATAKTSARRSPCKKAAKRELIGTARARVTRVIGEPEFCFSIG